MPTRTHPRPRKIAADARAPLKTAKFNAGTENSPRPSLPPSSRSDSPIPPTSEHSQYSRLSLSVLALPPQSPPLAELPAADAPAATDIATTAASAPVDDVASLKEFDPIAFNKQSEKAFLALVRSLLSQGVTRRKDIAREAAYRLDISTLTAERYLDKYCALSGPFLLRAGNITLK